MMANVLADMAVEVEAATLMALRVAKATDHLETDAHEKASGPRGDAGGEIFQLLARVAIANEALQCHGGNGFVEDGPMARLYREAPLNSVWEGTANMMCMDVRRAMAKDPRTIEALFDETRPLLGQDDRFDALVMYTEGLIRQSVDDEFVARQMTEAVARVLQGAELMRHSTQNVVDVFSPPASQTGPAHGGRTTAR